MKQEIGDEQTQPPYPWGSIDANALVAGAVSQDLGCKDSKSFLPE